MPHTDDDDRSREDYNRQQYARDGAGIGWGMVAVLLALCLSVVVALYIAMR